MDPVKVKGITDWPVPRKVKEVQSFLGFINFYCCFIKDFSHIAHPLHTLTRKAVEWKWGDPQQKAFEALKHAITTAPVLVFPSDKGKFRIEADASNFLQQGQCCHSCKVMRSGSGVHVEKPHRC